MTNPAGIKVILELDNRQYVAQLQTADRATTQFGQGARAAGRDADSMASALARVAHYSAGGAGLYVVAQAAMSAGKALFDASAVAQRLTTQLNFATNGQAVQEMAHVRQVANQLGLEFNSTAQAYAGFAAAAKGTALEGSSARAVFESMAKASAVMGLSADQTQGALLAVQQMMSKGTVSAEEFRGQLGERMPIALQAGAQALGVTTAEFSKLLETGQIVAEDFLPKFAQAMDKLLGDSATQAAGRLDAAVARMGNAWENLKKSAGDSGVSESIAKGMGWITADVQAVSEAMDGARRNGAGFFGQMNQGLGMVIGRAAGLGLVNRDFMTLEQAVANAQATLKRLDEYEKREGKLSIYSMQERASAVRDLARASRELAAASGKNSEKEAASNTLEGIRAQGMARERFLQQQTKDREAADAMRLKAAGVPESYLKDMQEVMRLHAVGALTGQAYTDVLHLMQESLLKKTGAAKEDKKVSDSELINIRARIVESQRYIDALRAEGGQAVKLNEGEKLAIKLKQELATGIKGAERAMKLKALAEAETLASILKTQAAEESKVKGLESSREETAKQADQAWAAAEAVKTQADQQEAANATTGKSKTAIQEMTLALLQHQLAEADSSDRFDPQYVAGLRAKVAEQERFVQLLKAADGITIDTGLDKWAEEARERARLYADEAGMAGLTAVQRAKINAERQVELRLARELAAIDKSSATEDEKERLRIKARTIAEEDKAGAVGKVIQDHVAKTGDDIQRTITDSLMRGVESGKPAFDALADTAKATFAGLVLQPTINAVVKPVAMATSTLLYGSPTGAASGSSGGLLGNIMGGASLMGGTFGAGLSAGAAALFGEAGLMGALDAGAIALGAGNVAGGLGTIAGALGPIALGLGAIAAVIKKFDDSGTPHTGGAAEASAEGVKALDAAIIGFGLSANEISAGVVKASKDVASGAVGLLNGLSKLGGGIANWSVATGFADDSSKDGAWGSLVISQGGAKVVDWRDTQSSRWAPKEFANGEAGQAEYAKALATSLKAAIDTIDLPAWAKKVLSAVGEDPSMEELSAAIEKINAMPGAVLQTLGTSADALSKTILDGLEKGDAKAAGQAFADTITQGAEQAIYGNFAGQITSIITTGLVTPVVTAMAAGATITEAMAAVSIDKMKTDAMAAASALKAILSDDAIKAGLKDINTLVAGIVTDATTGIQRPSAKAAPVLQSLGTSAEALSKTILEGLNKGDPKAAGQAFADTITYGAEQAIYGTFAGQITSIITTGLVTPVVTAMAAGATITEAMAAVSIDKMKTDAMAAASALKAILSDDAIKAGLKDINTLVAGIVTDATTGIPRPTFSAPSSADAVNDNALGTQQESQLGSLRDEAQALGLEKLRALGRGEEALALERAAAISQLKTVEEAEQARKNYALRDEIDHLNAMQALRDEARALEIDGLRAQGREAEALAAERADALAKISNAEERALAQANQARQDENRRLSEQTDLQTQLNALTDTAAQALERQRNALLGSNRALFDQVKAQEQLKRITESITAVAARYLTPEAGQAREYATMAAQLVQPLAAAGYNLGQEQISQLLQTTSLADLRDFANTLDLTTQAGRNAAEALLGMAGRLADLRAAAVDAALAGVQRAVDAEKSRIAQETEARKEALQAQIDALAASDEVARETQANITSILQSIKSGVASLRQNVLKDLAYADASAFVRQALQSALTTGYLPEAEALGDAVQAITARFSNKEGADYYATALDAKRERLLQANRLEALQAVAGRQKSVAEQQLDAAKTQTELLRTQLKDLDKASAAQLEALDAQLKAAQDSVSVLRGIDVNVATLPAALATLAQAIGRAHVGTTLGTGGSTPSGASATPPTGSTATPPSGGIWTGDGGALYNPTLLGQGALRLGNSDGTLYTVAEVREAVNGAVAAGNPAAVRDAAVAGGIPASVLDQVMGWPTGTANAAADALGLPRFAAGGQARGGAALVGEQGPEIAWFDAPARIYSASETRQIMAPGGGDAGEIAALRRQVDQLMDMLGQLLGLQLVEQQDINRRLKLWDLGGLPGFKANVVVNTRVTA